MKVKCNHCGLILPQGMAGTPCPSCPYGMMIEVEEEKKGLN